MRRTAIDCGGGRVAVREPRDWCTLPDVKSNGAINVDVMTIGSRTVDRCVSAAGVAVVIEPAADSSQHDECVSIAAAACAQHGFVAQEPRLAIAGKMPVIARMAMAARNVRIMKANLGTSLTIPKIYGRD